MTEVINIESAHSPSIRGKVYHMSESVRPVWFLRLFWRLLSGSQNILPVTGNITQISADSLGARNCFYVIHLYAAYCTNVLEYRYFRNSNFSLKNLDRRTVQKNLCQVQMKGHHVPNSGFLHLEKISQFSRQTLPLSMFWRMISSRLRYCHSTD